MNKVFEKSTLAGLVLENRIIRAATNEGMADENGKPANGLLAIYEKLAGNKVGAIITGYTAVHSNGRTARNVCLFDSDAYLDAYKRITEKITSYNVPLILQLIHGGGQCSKDVVNRAVAPSAVSYPMFPKPKAATEQEIQEIISAFVQAIIRAERTGFSGVEIHAGHGYLLSAFLSTHFNRRNDRWGGPLAKRFRIIKEIITRARRKVGEYPILIKISAHDGFKNGTNVDEAIQTAKMIQEAGFNAIEVSCGNADGFNVVRVNQVPVKAIFSFIPQYSSMSPYQKKIASLFIPLMLKKHRPLHNYNVEAAMKIKQHVSIPVIVVGGIRKLSDIEDIVSNGKADYVSMSRPFIIEPDIVSKFYDGKQGESRCIDCGYCLMGMYSRPLKCYYGRVKD